MRTQDLAGLWIDQIRLCARKTTHMDVGEIIVIKPIIRPRLDVVTFVGGSGRGTAA
jgi:hypothetical protein